MKKAIFASLSAGLLLTTANAQPKLNTLPFHTVAEFQSYFHYVPGHKPIISGHRGGTTTGYPENCIATCENTLRHTPAFFEIDPRLTKDSVIVVMHDATLDRTTTGTGKVSDYTYAQLQQFRLKDPQGHVTGFKIPTLKEMLLWSKGKTVLNLDHKDVPLEMTAKLLKECGNEMVMLTVHNAQQAKFYVDDDPDHMLSAWVLDRKAFDELAKAGIPWKNLIAYIGPTNKPENKQLFDLLHARGVMCMISAASSYDKLGNPAERDAHYRETFARGADILESDLPIEVAAALATH
ncbi:MAG TPA: glycerophosphodiester phosphodiesterase family protein [Puia sp.]|nr:glycerophosphodiester phosphodiesterase family protein [Puia sp.]